MEYPNFVDVCRDLSLERLLVLSRWIRKEAKAKGKIINAPALEIQEEGQTERARIRMGKLVERERMKKVMSKESLPRVRGKMIDNSHENGHNNKCKILPLLHMAIFVLPRPGEERHSWCADSDLQRQGPSNQLVLVVPDCKEWWS